MPTIAINLDCEASTCGKCSYSAISYDDGQRICTMPSFEKDERAQVTKGDRLPECIEAQKAAALTLKAALCKAREDLLARAEAPEESVR